jgi:MFS family permease
MTPEDINPGRIGGLPKSSEAESQKEAPPPDGGLQAWTQVLLTHLVCFNTWGVANSYGVFQSHYSTTLALSPSSISWIGSVQVFFLFSVGVLAGRLTDAGHFRPVFALGVFLQLLGIFMTSLAQSYWQIFLAQALCLGLGNGFTFCPALAVLAGYFKRRRALAVGLAVTGAATGGLVYPTIIDQLTNESDVGFPWAVRVMGFVMLATYIPCLIWFRHRLEPRKTGPLIDSTALGEWPFVFFTASMFFNFWGLYFAFFYLGNFARDVIGLRQPIVILMVLNGVGIPGRVLPSVVADQVTGPLNILIPLSVAAAVLIYAWAAVSTQAGLYVFAVLYGIVASALQSLFPTVATTMTSDPRRTGTRVGMIFTVVSFATLTGPAICGALIQQGGGNYLYAQMFAASSVLLGSGCAVAARLAKTGWVMRAKV